MFKKIAVSLVALAALTACGSYTPDEKAARQADSAQGYSERTVSFEKTLPSGVKVTCLLIDGYPDSLQCFPNAVR